MSELDQYLLLLRYHTRMFVTRSARMLRESKLAMLAMALFLAGYAFMSYWLFTKGLFLVERVPGIGGFLGDRIIYLIFFFFLLMLIFSVGITNYISLIKGRDIGWLLTLPVTHRVIFLWKSTEAILFASWGLVFISGPLLVAFATSRYAPESFYWRAALCVLPFVTIAAVTGSVLFLGILRWVSRPVGMTLAAIVLAWIGWSAIGAYEDAAVARERTMGVVAINELLKHTEMSVHPFLPSSWLSRSLIQWTRELQHDAVFHAVLLWTWALMGVVAMSAAGRSWFYSGWNRNLQRAGMAVSRRRERRRGKAYGWKRYPNRVLGLGRPLRAVIRKDIKTFLREPSQWVQFAIVFGLLLLYVLNLRNLGYDYENRFWAALISAINFTVCSLAVSTLTTRFVFPQFSLEGTRIWILGMAPMPLHFVVLQKWIQGFVTIGFVTTALQILSGLVLKLPAQDIALYASSIAILSIGLCGIAVGLGAVFPNLEETNAAKIVSGFGGTLCLICSFFYILAFVTLLCLAKADIFRGGPRALPVEPLGVGTEVAVLGAIALTVVFAGVPLLIAMRRVHRMELLTPS